MNSVVLVRIFGFSLRTATTIWSGVRGIRHSIQAAVTMGLCAAGARTGWFD